LKNRDTFTDRLEAQAKAKQALLEKTKQIDPTGDPEFAARQKARQEAARIREEREVERRQARAGEIESQRAERAARAARKVEEQRQAAEEARRKADEIRLAAEAAAREAARQGRNARPASLGLKDLKAALESRGK